jgi:CheY-like chemotaxis protein
MLSQVQMARPKILIAEDDDDVREGLMELIGDSGFEVISAENGEVALDLLRKNPDVRAILLDVAMPVMNGATFRGQQLADPAIADIPLILITGREDITPMANALGAVACLRKPCVGEAVLRTLDRYR